MHNAFFYFYFLRPCLEQGNALSADFECVKSVPCVCGSLSVIYCAVLTTLELTLVDMTEEKILGLECK